MDAIGGLLREAEFWLFYQTGGDENGLDESVLQAHVECTIDDEGFIECEPLIVSLNCLTTYSFELKIQLDTSLINLDFQQEGDSTRYQIGWWDNSRWHPFGLRWSELMLLRKYWESDPERIPVSPEEAFLLLAKFVGTGASELEQIPERKDIIRSTYRNLEVEFSKPQLKELVSSTFLLPPEDDYDWSENAEHGAMFSGSYACYSLRNRDHLDGKEGKFPFGPFNLMIKQIGKGR